jgi:hypothetical protein
MQEVNVQIYGDKVLETIRYYLILGNHKKLEANEINTSTNIVAFYNVHTLLTSHGLGAKLDRMVRTFQMLMVKGPRVTHLDLSRI